MKKLYYLLCLSGFLAGFMMMLPSSHSQEKSSLAVFEFQAIGVDEITAQVSWQLLHTELVNTNKFRVIETEEISRILGPDAICYDVQCASELGRQLQADKVVIGSLSRLGMKIVVNLRMVNVAQAAVEFEDRLISEQEEDLDIVMKRLALGLATGKKAEDTAALGAITEQETREPRRRATFYTSGLKIGFLWPQTDSYGEAKKLTAVDFTTWYETPSFVVEALTGFRGGDGAYDFPIDFSLFLVPHKGDFAAYFGGGLGIHWVKGTRSIPEQDPYYHHYYYAEKEEHDNGLAFNVGGGVIAFRTYDFRLRIDLRFTYVMATLGEKEGQSGVCLSFGINYKREKGSGGGGCLFF